MCVLMFFLTYRKNFTCTKRLYTEFLKKENSSSNWNEIDVFVVNLIYGFRDNSKLAILPF